MNVLFLYKQTYINHTSNVANNPYIKLKSGPCLNFRFGVIPGETSVEESGPESRSYSVYLFTGYTNLTFLTKTVLKIIITFILNRLLNRCATLFTSTTLSQYQQRNPLMTNTFLQIQNSDTYLHNNCPFSSPTLCYCGLSRRPIFAILRPI